VWTPGILGSRVGGATTLYWPTWCCYFYVNPRLLPAGERRFHIFTFCTFMQVKSRCVATFSGFLTCYSSVLKPVVPSSHFTRDRRYVTWFFRSKLTVCCSFLAGPITLKVPQVFFFLRVRFDPGPLRETVLSCSWIFPRNYASTYTAKSTHRA
jgi:hypothetical protein